MNSIALAAAMMCSHFALDAEMEKIAIRSRPLHQHPTLVKMLHENNQWRQRVGLPPHRMSARLTKAAQDHAWYMARTGQFSHHSNLGPSGRAAKYGYWGPLSENIAMGQGGVQSAFQSWRSSSGHWANITSGSSHAGFGFARSPSGETFWVAVYGDDVAAQDDADEKSDS